MEGHQKDATFDNKLGRSAYFCNDERENEIISINILTTNGVYYLITILLLINMLLLKVIVQHQNTIGDKKTYNASHD